MTSTSTTNVNWFAPVDLSGQRSAPIALTRVYPCRCGVDHESEEDYLAHEALAPMPSPQARRLRELLSRYLSGEIFGEEFSAQIALCRRNSGEDREAEELSTAVDWAFCDYGERKGISKEGLLKTLRNLSLPPTLGWSPRPTSLEPGEWIS